MLASYAADMCRETSRSIRRRRGPPSHAIADAGCASALGGEGVANSDG